jgi:hypothetical protein
MILNDKVKVSLTVSHVLAVTMANKLREARVELTRISNSWAAELGLYEPGSDPWIYANTQAEFFADIAKEAWDAAKSVLTQARQSFSAARPSPHTSKEERA